MEKCSSSKDQHTKAKCHYSVLILAVSIIINSSLKKVSLTFSKITLVYFNHLYRCPDARLKHVRLHGSVDVIFTFFMFFFNNELCKNS